MTDPTRLEGPGPWEASLDFPDVFISLGDLLATIMFTHSTSPAAHCVPSTKGVFAVHTAVTGLMGVPWGEGTVCDEGDKGSEGAL